MRRGGVDGSAAVAERVKQSNAVSRTGVVIVRSVVCVA